MLVSNQCALVFSENRQRLARQLSFLTVAGLIL